MNITIVLAVSVLFNIVLLLVAWKAYRITRRYEQYRRRIDQADSENVIIIAEAISYYAARMYEAGFYLGYSEEVNALLVGDKYSSMSGGKHWFMVPRWYIDIGYDSDGLLYFDKGHWGGKSEVIMSGECPYNPTHTNKTNQSQPALPGMAQHAPPVGKAPLPQYQEEPPEPLTW